jgi:hypothetical protein
MPDPSHLPDPHPELEPMAHYLDYLVMERVAEFSDKILTNDPQFQTTRAEMDKFLKILENMLPAPGSAVVLTAINETASVLATRCQELIYRRGLEDGAELIRILTKQKREQGQNQNQDSGD